MQYHVDRSGIEASMAAIAIAGGANPAEVAQQVLEARKETDAYMRQVYIDAEKSRRVSSIALATIMSVLFGVWLACMFVVANI